MGFMSKIKKPLALGLAIGGGALTITGSALLGVGCTTSYSIEKPIKDASMGYYTGSAGSNLITQIPEVNKLFQEGSVKISIGTGSSNYNSFPNVQIKSEGKYWSIPDIIKDFDKKADLQKLAGMIQGGSPASSHGLDEQASSYAAPAVTNEAMKVSLYQQMGSSIISLELQHTFMSENNGKELTQQQTDEMKAKAQQEATKIKSASDLIDVYNEETSKIGNIFLEMYINAGLEEEWDSTHKNGEEYNQGLVYLNKLSYSDVVSKSAKAKTGFEASKKTYEDNKTIDHSTQEYKESIEEMNKSIDMMGKVGSANGLMISGAVLLPIFAIVMGFGIAALVINKKTGKNSKSNLTDEATKATSTEGK